MADDDGGNELTEEERFDAYYEKRRAAEKADAERAKKMKDLGLTDEVLDTIADRVWDRGEARAADRKRKADESDQEPSRGGDKPTVVEKLFGVGRAANDG